MTAYTQSDRRSLLLERRRLYEAEVVEALLNEEPEEREERVHLVRACQPMLVAALHGDLSIYDPEKYRE
jgi:hypothetical protein